MTDVQDVRRSMALLFLLFSLTGLWLQTVFIDQEITLESPEIDMSEFNLTGSKPEVNAMPTAVFVRMLPAPKQITHRRANECTLDPQMCKQQLNDTLTWVQTQMVLNGTLQAGEYLMLDAIAGQGDCVIRIRSVTDREMTDWLCFGETGLYRLSQGLQSATALQP